MSWIKNKNVIITGVSTGIGKELAKLFVNKYHCKVLGVARSVGKLEALKTELGENFSFYPMDISSRENWEAFAAGAATEFKPDILINNAGMIHPFANICDLSDRDVERTVNTNYLSHIYAARTMIPVLEKSAYPGYVNIASASALLPVAGQSIYSSTKAAVYAMSECIRQEYEGEGWYVGYVLPGPVKTDLYNAKASDGAEAKAKVKDGLITKIGQTAPHAAKVICRCMARRQSRIVLGAVAHLMGFGHQLFPRTVPSMASKPMSVLPLQSFKDIFKNTKANKAARKAQRKALKAEKKAK